MKISTEKRNKYWIRINKSYNLFDFLSSFLNLFESLDAIKNNLNLNLYYGDNDSVYLDEKEIITFEEKILLNAKKKVYEIGRLIGEIEICPYDKTTKSKSELMIIDNKGLEIIGVYKVDGKYLILKNSELVGLISIPFWGSYIEVSFNEPELLTYMIILGESFFAYLQLHYG